MSRSDGRRAMMRDDRGLDEPCGGMCAPSPHGDHTDALEMRWCGMKPETMGKPGVCVHAYAWGPYALTRTCYGDGLRPM